MTSEGPREALRRALLRGLGKARRLLPELPPGDREALLLESLATLRDGEAALPVHAAYLAELARLFGPESLPERLLSRLSQEAGEEGNEAVRAMLCGLYERGAPLPPLSLQAWLEEGDPRNVNLRLPALQALAAEGDPGRLRQIVEATRPGLLDGYDARSWGEALAASGEPGIPFLKELLLSPHPWVRLGAGYALVCQPLPDPDLEVVAEILSFDPDPEVRANSIELRAESDLGDPLGICVRLLSDPETRNHLDGWLWTLACEVLPPESVPPLLRELDEQEHPDPEDVATLLEESQHPLALPLLQSRLLTSSGEERSIFLEALERQGRTPDPEVLQGIPLDEAPDRVLVLRAQTGDTEAARLLFQRMRRGELGSDALDASDGVLVGQALVPLALEVLASQDLLERARVLHHLRRFVPPAQRPPRGTRGLGAGELLIRQETLLDLLEGLVPRTPAQLRDLVRNVDSELKLAVLDRLTLLPPPPERSPVEILARDDDSRVRYRAYLLLLGWSPQEEHHRWLQEALEDSFGPNRSELLLHLRSEDLPVPEALLRDLLWDALPAARAEAARLVAERLVRTGPEHLRERLEVERTPWVRTLLVALVQATAPEASNERGPGITSGPVPRG